MASFLRFSLRTFARRLGLITIAGSILIDADHLFEAFQERPLLPGRFAHKPLLILALAYVLVYAGYYLACDGRLLARLVLGEDYAQKL